MLQVAWTMHRGICRQQQDAMLVAGQVRQSRNLLPTTGSAASDLLLAVGDGVASTPSAGRASRCVLSALSGLLARQPGLAPDGLLSGRHVRLAQQALCAARDRGEMPFGAATTLVAAHIRGAHAAIINVGDSRAYLARSDGRVRQLSHDHTELQRLRDAGELDDGVEYASVYGFLSDCLAADPDDDGFALHRDVVALEPGDRIALCSDGVHDALGEASWRALLAEAMTPAELVPTARAAVLRRGAPDNFYLIVAQHMPEQ